MITNIDVHSGVELPSIKVILFQTRLHRASYRVTGSQSHCTTANPSTIIAFEEAIKGVVKIRWEVFGIKHKDWKRTALDKREWLAVVCINSETCKANRITAAELTQTSEKWQCLQIYHSRQHSMSILFEKIPSADQFNYSFTHSKKPTTAKKTG